MKNSKEILKNYVLKRFGSKKKFLGILNDRLEHNFSERKSYNVLFDEMDNQIGIETVLSVLGIKNFEEAKIRTQLAELLYKGLVETTYSRQLSPLFERVIGKKVKIWRKVDKKQPAYQLAFESTEEEFIEAWKSLYKEGILPTRICFKNLTVGPLGWLKSRHKRKKDFEDPQYFTVFDIIHEKSDSTSQNNFMASLWNTLEQIAANPEKFEIPKEEGKHVAQCLKKINSERDSEIKFAMTVQILAVYLDDAALVHVVNTLVANGDINLKVRGLYEKYPYSFSDWVITPYGIFRQIPSWERKPNKKLAAILLNTLQQEDLEPELEHYQGNYPLRVLEYCIKKGPEVILEKAFGLPRLRKIAKDLGIEAAAKIRDKHELIRLISLKLGFRVPPTLEGIVQYQNFLDSAMAALKAEKSLMQIMPEVYNETEGILRDLVYFYVRFLWQQEEFATIIKDELGIPKPFEKLGFGYFIDLMRQLNSKVRRGSELRERLSSIFERKQILPEKYMELLNEISQYRSTFDHKVKRIRPDRKNCIQIVEKLRSFAQYLEKAEIYPRVVQIKLEITNEYGTEYFEAIDDKGNHWTIEATRVDPSQPYFMHSRTTPVAVNPLLIEKKF